MTHPNDADVKPGSPKQYEEKAKDASLTPSDTKNQQGRHDGRVRQPSDAKRSPQELSDEERLNKPKPGDAMNA